MTCCALIRDKMYRLRLTFVLAVALVITACMVPTLVTVFVSLFSRENEKSTGSEMMFMKHIMGSTRQEEDTTDLQSSVVVSLSHEEVDELNARTKSSLYIGTGVGLYSSGGQVLELRGNEVDHALRSGYEMVIAFYAPWCGHCQRFVRPYSDLASAIQPMRNVTFCAVNCDKERKVCARYRIYTYPTVIAFNFARDMQQICITDMQNICNKDMH